jgi:hypothetical protein
MQEKDECLIAGTAECLLLDTAHTECSILNKYVHTL